MPLWWSLKRSRATCSLTGVVWVAGAQHELQAAVAAADLAGQPAGGGEVGLKDGGVADGLHSDHQLEGPGVRSPSGGQRARRRGGPACP